ncbi:MAG: metallophosphoesterase family protein [Candidatus Lokiarchaeota archaeon]|nr:metallophosphoesterase family protein [Candidatus Lokiarchaeota archaeon]
MKWFIADTHFYHKRAIKHNNRPFKDIHEMNDYIVKQWNAVIKKTDTVYVLGDFSWGNQKQIRDILTRLHGYKILIYGNHDKRAWQMIRAGFKDVRENIYINLNGHKVYLSHYPYYPTWLVRLKLWWHGYDKWKKYTHKQMRRDDHWLIHGHIHNNRHAWKIKDKQINVGVDQWNFKPVSEKTIVEIIEGRYRG